jgi:D-beta-D-heptose 7-phosphate kinase/D-beta-D-heptose 1-phosphate adenosyltransferase
MDHKCITRQKLPAIIAREQQKGKKIVFTNGCFDILHAGHVTYLEKARELGDILVVGLNTDSSVQLLKGPKRPIVPESDRAILLCALESVSYVTLFSDETPINLIKELRPDILVKGEDYADKLVVGQEFVESIGGSVELITLVAGRGTTNIIDEVIKRYNQS